MPGLELGVMGGVRAKPTNMSSATTATEAAFGPGYTRAGMPSTADALTPNDPFGITFWVGVVALALLIVVRQSLPE